MSTSRKRTAAVMTSAATLVVGAMIGAVWVTAGIGSAGSPTTPDTVTVHQAAATATPTATTTKTAVVKKAPAKKAATKKTTTTKARTLVSNQAADPAPADEPSEAPPLNGGGRGSDPQPTLVLPTGNPPPGN